MFEIIIPVYGAIQHLMRCLRPLENYPVILVDDGNQGNDAHNLKVLERKYRNVRLVIHETNRGFIEACRSGVNASQASRILFLNSDTVPNAEAINALQDDEGAITGCRLLFPDGRIQHAGVARNWKGQPYHPFMGLDGDTPHTKRILSVNAVTGAAFAIDRRVWDDLGGFDRHYGLGVFEDVALCWKASGAGYRIVYRGDVSMIHVMHGSYVQGQPYFHDGGAENMQRLLRQFEIGSDEEIFYGSLKEQPE